MARRLYLALGLTVALAALGTARAQQVYFGTLHAHSSYSDGTGTPAEAFAMAKANKMHFLAVTEHNHLNSEPSSGSRKDGVMIAKTPALYNGTQPSSLKSAAAKATVAGGFVAIYGQEFSTIGTGNHVNVFDAPSVIGVPKGEFKQLVEWLDQNPDSSGLPPLLQFNHPEWTPQNDNNYGRDDFGPGDKAWIAAMGAKTGLIEVINGTATKPGEDLKTHAHQRAYFNYLNLGFRLGPTVGHDNHYRNWGKSTRARTGVVASALTRDALMKALRGRHTYASEDDDLRVVFRANGALMGSAVAAPDPDSELDLTVELSDPDEPDATYVVEVYRDRPGGEPMLTPVQSFVFKGNVAAPRKLDGVFFEGAGEYVLLKVIQKSMGEDDHLDVDDVWTAPVWFDEAGVAPPAVSAPAALRLVSLVPDPMGSDLLYESVTLKNVSPNSVGLGGWQLRDTAGSYWTFDPQLTIGADRTLAIVRARQPLSLNNGGDTVELLDPDGQVVQTFTYGPVAVDEVVTID